MTIARYGVMGNPVQHSKSPKIHQLFAAQFDLRIKYDAIFVEKTGFKKAVEDFFKSDGCGLNITVPFKQEAFMLSIEHGEAARLAEAVNTLTPLTVGQIRGDNTDGIGLTRDLQNNLDFKLAEKNILIVGAGGATQGILGPLLKHHANIALINRTAAKAHALAQHFAKLGKIVSGGLDMSQQKSFDLIINATSASLGGALPTLPNHLFASNALAYDLAYSNEPTPFMRWAQHQGAARITDGLGMLVEQAAESFYIWHHKRPKTEAVLKALRTTI